VKSRQTDDDSEARFTCQLYNKVKMAISHRFNAGIDQWQALLSVFKSRISDVRDKDTAVERCECYIQDQPDKTECRLVVKMICRHGM
jgi:cell cycle checkpoint control protein RAD9A